MAMALFGAPIPVEAATPTSFVCNVNGAELLKPKIAPAAICAQIKQSIETATKVRLQAVAALPKVNTRSVASLKIDVSMRKPGIIAAIVTQQNRRMIKVHPEISIAVLDRVVDARDIDLLAREIARMIKLNQSLVSAE